MAVAKDNLAKQNKEKNILLNENIQKKNNKKILR